MGNSTATIRLGNPGSEHVGTGPIIIQKGLRFPLENQRNKGKRHGGGEGEEKTCASVCYNFKHPHFRKKN